MKVWIMGLGLAAMNLGLAQSVPGTGFSELLCRLGVAGSGTFELGNGQIVVSVTDNGVTDTVGTASISIQHGKSGSIHTLTYEDTNGDGFLDCGDTVLGLL